jgi:hypothetical protein
VGVGRVWGWGLRGALGRFDLDEVAALVRQEIAGRCKDGRGDNLAGTK